MADGPRVGDPSDDYRAVCVYSFQPGDPQCDEPATWHVIKGIPKGLIGLSTCDEHAPIARAAGHLIAEHRHAGICGLPGSIWLPHRNVCVIDDSGVEPELAGRASRSGDPR